MPASISGSTIAAVSSGNMSEIQVAIPPPSGSRVTLQAAL